jgi:hypothetical protein
VGLLNHKFDAELIQSLLPYIPYLGSAFVDKHCRKETDDGITYDELDLNTVTWESIYTAVRVKDIPDQVGRLVLAFIKGNIWRTAARSRRRMHTGATLSMIGFAPFCISTFS